MKLRKSTFKYIEQELYDYHRTQKSLKELTDDIMHSTPPYKEIRISDPSDVTYFTVSLLVTNKLRQRMIDTLLAIEIAFIELDPFVREVFEDKYWKRNHLSWSDISEQHHAESRTVYRWRKVFIEDIAKRLGMS